MHFLARMIAMIVCLYKHIITCIAATAWGSAKSQNKNGASYNEHAK